MTLVAVRIENDAISVLSDSRLTYPSGGHWDGAQKILHVQPTGHFVAFAGSTVTSLLAANQAMTALAYSRHLGVDSDNLEAVGAMIELQLVSTFRNCPGRRSRFQLLLIGKGKLGLGLVVLEHLADGSVTRRVQNAPGVYFFGSGASVANLQLATINAPSLQDVYSVVRQVIANPTEPTVGGRPQLATIRLEMGLPVPTVTAFETNEPNRVTSILGVPVFHDQKPEGIEVRDLEFQEVTYRPTQRNAVAYDATGLNSVFQALMDDSLQLQEPLQDLVAEKLAVLFAGQKDEESVEALLAVKSPAGAAVPTSVRRWRIREAFYGVLAVVSAGVGVGGAATILAGVGAGFAVLLAVRAAFGAVTVDLTRAQGALVYVLCCNHAKLSHDALAKELNRIAAGDPSLNVVTMTAARERLEEFGVIRSDTDGVELVEDWKTWFRLGG